ncbi:cyclin-O [Polymixia lowei]
MSRLSDSGFEEDMSSLTPSPVRMVVSPLRPGEPATTVRELSDWYRHYGDIGFKIQKEKETEFHPSKCLARQPQVTAEARCKLVSWLIPVHKHLHLSFECCCLAVNIMDRFLASTPVAADCFQLLGVTALLLASKQVEVFSPQISQLLSLCCEAFTKEQLCNLECLILLRLNFRLAAPTLAFFLDYYTCSEAAQLQARDTSSHRSAREHRQTQTTRQCSHLSRRICELSLADYAFNKYPPSLTAVCALTIADDFLEAGQGLEVPNDQFETRDSSKLIQSQAEKRGAFVHDLSDNEQSLTDSAPAQLVDGSGPPQNSPVPVENHFLSVVLDGHSYRLAQECQDNLKLLVSLNQETLQVMSSI